MFEMDHEGIVYNGYPSEHELRIAPGTPSMARLQKGPCAVIECVQYIPCNPCETACPFGAITIGDNIINLPVLDAEKCNGCGTCIAKCPGLAIFTVNMTYGENKASVEFPYEYIPLPQEGDIVDAVNRRGTVVCKAEVIRVRSSAAFVNTCVVQLSIPKEYANQIRSMKRLPQD